MTRRKKIWLGVTVLVGIAVIALAVFSGALIKPALEYAIRSNGFPNANIETVTVIPNGIVLENIYLDADAFSTIEAAQVTGSWLDILLHRKIGGITLKNVELSGEIDEQGQYIIAGWNASLAAADSSDSSASVNIENIDVSGMTLDFETPEGAIRIEGKLALQSKADRSRDFQVNVWGKQKQLALNATATGTIRPDGQWTSDIELLEGRIDLDAIKATRAAGTVKLASVPTGITYVGKLAAGGVRIQDIPFQDFEVAFDSHNKEILNFKTSPTGHDGIILSGRLLNLSPLTLEAGAKITRMNDIASLLDVKPDALAWAQKTTPLELTVSAPFADLSAPAVKARWSVTAGDIKQTISGTATYTRENSAISGTLSPVSLPGDTISALLPLRDLADLEITTGKADLEGSFSTVPGSDPFKVDGSLKLNLRDIGGTWQDYPFNGIRGELALTQLMPWQLAKNQTLRADVIGTGINLTDGLLTFDGQDKSSLAIREARFDIAGGKISAAPFKWSATAKENNVVIKMDGIDLATLAQIVDADGFSADGKLSGSLPMTFTKKGIVFRDNASVSTENGTFRYAPSKFPAALQGDDVRMQTVRTALSDFNYSTLEIGLGGALNGDMKTTLKASGKNPVFKDRVINLNINLEGALVPVLQEALQPGRITDKIEKSVAGGRIQ